MYPSGLQAVVQHVQQLWSPDSKAKNPIVVQSIRLDVSAGLQCTLEFLKK